MKEKVSATGGRTSARGARMNVERHAPPTRALSKRRLQQVRTRRLILQAARETFAARGFESPSIQVARAAGISRAAVYLHYKSREELMLAVFEREVLFLVSEAAALVQGHSLVVNGGLTITA